MRASFWILIAVLASSTATVRPAMAGQGCTSCAQHEEKACGDDKSCDSGKSCSNNACGCEGKPLCDHKKCKFCQFKCQCPLQDCCLFYHFDRNNYAEVDAVNCQCNGSYKFPVPPLYTYHWPGMYSQQLMTDYQSPWRFPPLKPYTDEPSRAASLPTTPNRTVSFTTEEPRPYPMEGEPISAKIARLGEQ